MLRGAKLRKSITAMTSGDAQLFSRRCGAGQVECRRAKRGLTDGFIRPSRGLGGEQSPPTNLLMGAESPDYASIRNCFPTF
jgi:hypothetical protein